MQAAAQRYCVSQQGLRSGRRAEERPQSLKRCVVINHKTTKFESAAHTCRCGSHCFL